MTVRNFDERTVRSFGAEWAHFDQGRLAHETKTEARFNEYFGIFPWSTLPAAAVGADVGCGSGRWAALVAPRVGQLHCLDASYEALDVARRNLAWAHNCTFHHASVDAMPVEPGSLDFCYSLGVLHHVPDPVAGIRSCVALLKPGAPLLLYLYYALDDRPGWYRAIWRGADLVRRIIARMPLRPKRLVTDVVALFAYWPLARFAALVELLGGNPANLPLNWYRDKTFYTMRTNALDRFGTPIEHRFTRHEIETMLREAGLTEIRFSDAQPFWCVVSRRGGPHSSV
ncbi:class I SAM-dependent methyltransferase [Rhodopila globiformis]|uniref:SAM-dependent methyltransferase n=1 Tax=Rhodopila globiformis TaxID=1071 RepID=A0A2S6NCA4_RHOGL|nr:class I SAM-dependent methyltransferase [Rhodopila globiformis]PPQ32211.1 SAM-dependent methyltransferase [Rhodopila globiformis]